MADPSDPSTYTQDVLDMARSHIHWDEFVAIGRGESDRADAQLFLTQKDVDAIKSSEGELPEAVIELLETNDEMAVAYIRALFKAVRTISHLLVRRFVLATLERLCEEEGARGCACVARAGGADCGKAVDALLGLRRSGEDAFVVAKSARLSALLLTDGEGLLTDGRAAEVLLWSLECLDSGRSLLRRERFERDQQLKDGSSNSPTSKKEEAPATSMARAVGLLDKHGPDTGPKSRSPVFGVAETDVGQKMRTGKAFPADEAHTVQAALESLMVALRSSSLRAAFVAERGVERLLPLLCSHHPQRQYEAAFCLWALSLEESGIRAIERADESFRRLGDLVRPGVVTVKVVRMAVGTLARVVTLGSLEAVPALHEAAPHVRSELATFLTSRRADEDPELKADATALVEALDAGETQLSTVDRWKRELDAGQFHWGPAHTPEFWAENHLAFEANSAKLLKSLAALLADPASTPTTLAVAAFDAGEFATQHPGGKYIVQRVGLRNAVLELVEHSDPLVRRHALLALSKMMISRWQFLDQ